MHFRARASCSGILTRKAMTGTSLFDTRPARSPFSSSKSNSKPRYCCSRVLNTGLTFAKPSLRLVELIVRQRRNNGLADH